MCLACGTQLAGPHCHACGQRARTLKAAWHDAIASEPPGTMRRIGRTLRLLVAHPGALTHRYLQGERRPFVAPGALALAALAVLFIVSVLLGAGAGGLRASDPALSMTRADADMRAALTDAEGEPTQIVASSERARQDRIERGRSALFFLDQARAAWDPDTDPLDAEAQLTRGEAPSLRRQLSDPVAFAGAVGRTGPTLGWVLLLLMPPVLWLLFAGRGRTFTLLDHAVFCAHSLAFAALLGLPIAVAGALGVAAPVLGGVFSVGWVVHGAVHLRGAYGLTIAGTAWRLVVLAAWTAIVLSLLATLWLAAGAV